MNQKALFATLIVLFTFSQTQAFPFARKQKTRIAKTKQKLPRPFSLKGPKGWYLINDPSQLPDKVKFIYVGSGKGQFTPSINLAIEETDITSTEYLDMAKRYHESQPETHCQFLGKIATKAGAAHLLQIERETGFGKVRFIQAVMVRDKMAHVITATALADEYGELYPSFFEAVQSFNIVNK